MRELGLVVAVWVSESFVFGVDDCVVVDVRTFERVYDFEATGDTVPVDVCAEGVFSLDCVAVAGVTLSVLEERTERVCGWLDVEVGVGMISIWHRSPM